MNRKRNFSKHARIRGAQRAIPELVVDLLVNYGELHEQPGGSCVVEFSEETDAWLREQLRATLAHWDQRRSAYAVLGDGGVVVTVGHRRK